MLTAIGSPTWTMAAQVIESGRRMERTTYPYAPTQGRSDQDSRVHLPRLPGAADGSEHCRETAIWMRTARTAVITAARGNRR